MCEQLKNYTPLIVSCVLEVLVTLAMLMTSSVDPGIIPTNVKFAIFKSIS